MSVTIKTIVKDMGWKRIQAELRLADRSHVKTGYPGETPKMHPEAGQTMAQLAAVHEYGSPANNIPARPFMRQTADANMEKAKALSRQLYKGIVQGRLTAEAGLGRMGEWYVGATKRIFINGTFAPLKPATIAAKRSSRPLVDTGQLRNSIVSRVIMVGSNWSLKMPGGPK